MNLDEQNFKKEREEIKDVEPTHRTLVSDYIQMGTSQCLREMQAFIT